MPPSKPHWFTFRDLLFPGSIALAAIGCLVWVLLAGDLQSATPGKALPTGVFGVHGLVALVALVASGIYARLLWLRRRELSEFVYIRGPYYSVMLHPGRFQGDFSQIAVAREFQAAFDQWSKVFTHEIVWRMAHEAVFWVWLKPANLVDGWSREKVAGYTVPRSRRLVVAYQASNDLLAATALRHEIGHVIQGEVTGDWTESEHHLRSQTNSIR